METGGYKYSDEGFQMKLFVYGTLVVLMVVDGVCLCAPEPAIVPSQGQWTVDVEFTHLQQIILPTGNIIQSNRFWYTIITITNNTDDDIVFYPKCELMTDTFQIKSAGTSVGPSVFEKIKLRHKSRYPFLEYIEKTGNILHQGEENAKDIVIIWPDFDTQARSLKVFMTGFSNETVVVDHPVLKDIDNMPVKVFLRKTLELNYELESETSTRSDKSLIFKGKRWIMR
jgi:hypothetical protein